MTRLVWGQSSDRDYESGLDRGVFYPLGGLGHVWNGLISVNESPSGGESRPRYIDGQKTQDRRSREQFQATIEAFTYPTVISAGLVTPRRPQRFDLSYRVHTAKGYRIHIIYNALAVPAESNFEQSNANNFSWSISTRAPQIMSGVYSAHLYINSWEAYPQVLQQVEDILYGSDADEARMLTPAELLDLFEANAILRIIDNGDGTWTAIGPDGVVSMLDDDTFQIDFASAQYIDADTYTVHSM